MKSAAPLLAALAASAFWACEAPRTPAPAEPAEKPVRIGFSVPSSRETRWRRDAEQMRKQAAALGVELYTETADNDAAQQQAQCDALLAKGLSVLIVAPHDAQAAAEIVRRARRAGARVIAYDRLILGEPADLYVSFDGAMIGRMHARSLAALAPRGNYVILSGPATDHNAWLYREGALETLKPLISRGDIKIVMDEPVPDWKASEAGRLVAEALRRTRGGIQAVLAPNDTTAGAAIEALAAAGLAGKVPVTGQDAEAAAARRIVEGTQSMTVFKDPRHQAGAAFGAAMTLSAGGRMTGTTPVNAGKTEVPALLLAPLLVNRENAAKVLVGTGFLKSSELYGTK